MDLQQRQDTNSRGSSRPGASILKSLTWPSIVLAALVLSLSGCIPASGQAPTAQAAASQPAPTVISAGTLEDQYGLHVNLIAVTAAGGLVDVRLKVLDAEKARQLFQSGTPSVLVDQSGVVLVAPDDLPPPDSQLKEDGGVILLLYPNSANTLKPGDEVTLMFGDVHLEPIAVK